MGLSNRHDHFRYFDAITFILLEPSLNYAIVAGVAKWKYVIVAFPLNCLLRVMERRINSRAKCINYIDICSSFVHCVHVHCIHIHRVSSKLQIIKPTLGNETFTVSPEHNYDSL